MIDNQYFICDFLLMNIVENLINYVFSIFFEDNFCEKYNIY